MTSSQPPTPDGEAVAAPQAGERLTVVVAGGGIAGVEGLLALRALGGDLIDLTLVSPGLEFVERPMTVTEPFALGHARRFPLEDVARDTQATLIRGSVSGVAPRWRSLVLENGASVDYDALLLTLGARLEAVIPKALTWTPDADPELLGGVLRDLEEGYASSVAFVIPPGVAWSLPAYELAMMTSRQVAGMDRSSIEVSVITPEHEPLADFGPHVTETLRHELQAGHVHLRTGATLVQRGAELQLEVNGEPVRADHIVALPRPMGVLIPGLPRDENGFIPVDRHGRVRDTERVWAAGDAVSYPLKHGGLAALQADAAAESIAFVAGADIEPKPFRPTLDGVLLTGERGRRLRDDAVAGAVPAGPGRPVAGKVAGRFLTPYLTRRDAAAAGSEPAPAIDHDPDPHLELGSRKDSR
jgi:sulfide:quinone oxidoreductase